MMGGLFGSASMLWWAGAAAVPIVIHLLSRRKYRKVPWAAMDFLQRAFKKTRRRLKFENLLLLLLRVLALMLLALALADPRTDGAGIFGTSSDRKNVILILDTSFSMDVRDEADVSSFLRAKNAALGIVGSLEKSSDSAALLTAGTPARLVLPMTREIDRVQNALDSFDVTHSSTDILGSLRRTVGLLSDPAFERDHPGATTIYLFTDLQKAPFLKVDADRAAAEAATGAAVPSDSPDPTAERLFGELRDLDARIIIVDVGQDERNDSPNVAVTEVRHVGKTLIAGLRTTFEGRIKNFGKTTAGGEVQFLVDREDRFEKKDRVIGLRGREDVAAGLNERTFTFSTTFKESGWHSIAVRYVDDTLKVDNIRRLAVFVRSHIRVLSVNGKNNREPDESATFFAARALDPFLGDSGEGTEFRVKDVGILDFQSEDITEFDILLLADVPKLPGRKIEEIERFVTAGGALIFFCGKSFEVTGRLGASGISTKLFYRGGSGLLPGQLLRTMGTDEFTDNPWFLQFDRFDHGAIAYFADEKIRPALTGVPTHKLVEITIPENAEGVTVLSWFRQKSGERVYPALIEKRFGRGKVYMFTTSADTTWNMLGTTPAYVPMLREVAYHATREARRANVLVGENLVVRFPPTIKRVTVQRTGGPPVAEDTSLAEDKSATELVLPRLTDAELVRIDAEGTTGVEGRRLVAVNIDPAESNLARADATWLSSHFGADLFTVVTKTTDLVAEARDVQQSNLWRFCLYVLLGVLALETAVAQIFGRKKAAVLDAA